MFSSAQQRQGQGDEDKEGDMRRGCLGILSEPLPSKVVLYAKRHLTLTTWYHATALITSVDTYPVELSPMSTYELM